MKRTIFLFSLLLAITTSVFAQSDYYLRQAKSYQQEAELYSSSGNL